jgi:hypothetical protein
MDFMLRQLASLILGNWGFELNDEPVSKQVLALHNLPREKGLLGLYMAPPKTLQSDLKKMFIYAWKLEHGYVPDSVEFSNDSWNLEC